MNVDTYLERIGYTRAPEGVSSSPEHALGSPEHALGSPEHALGSPEPTSETLRELQRAHLYSVPFENLDIPLKRAIVLDRARLYDKIILRRRGGFCYEVNGLFAWLLEQLGFEVDLLSARDAQDDGTFGLEYDHLTLRVHCPADNHPEIPWLADVGWGDSFIEPLRLDTAGEQPQGLRAYRIDRDGERLLLWQRNYDGSWERQYGFTLTPRAYADFSEMCHYHQTSPESPFTLKRIITRATPRGRVSLSEGRLIVTEDGKRTESEIEPDKYEAALLNYFGVVL